MLGEGVTHRRRLVQRHVVLQGLGGLAPGGFGRVVRRVRFSLAARRAPGLSLSLFDRQVALVNHYLAGGLGQDQHPTALVLGRPLILPTAEIVADFQHLDPGPAFGPQSIPPRGNGLVLQRPELGTVVEERLVAE